MSESQRGAITPILAQLNAGQLARAEQAALALTGADADNGHGWKVLGVIHVRHGRAQAALEAMRRATALLPGDAEAWRNLGYFLHACAQRAEALASFRAACQADPHDRLAQTMVGRLLMLDGALPDAVPALRGALALYLDAPPPAAAAQPQPQPPDQAAHLDLLWRTLAQLCAAGVHAFPCSGTLLGLERDGALLPFDKDLDLALPFSEMAAAVACLEAHGWLAVASQMQLVSPREMLHPATGMALDLCGVRMEAPGGAVIGGFWRAGLPWEWQRVIEYPPMTLHQRQGAHGSVWALDDPHAWLAALYGDWRRPDPDFDTVIAAHNLRGFSLLTECYGLYRLIQLCQEGRRRKAAALAGHLLRQRSADPLFQRAVAILA